MLNDPSRKKQVNEAQIDSVSSDDDAVSPVKNLLGDTSVARGSPSNRPAKGPGSRGGKLNVTFIFFIYFYQQNIKDDEIFNILLSLYAFMLILV